MKTKNNFYEKKLREIGHFAFDDIFNHSRDVKKIVPTYIKREFCKFSIKDILKNAKRYKPPLRVAYIYFLINKGVIVYVGQTTNFHLRIKQHKKNKEFTSIFKIKCNVNYLYKVENFYIKKFKPIYNK
jgi:hypothetical protein